MNRTPAINLPPAVLWLAVAFIAVHAARQFLSQDTDDWILFAFAFLPARYGEIASQLPGGEWARLWTPVTYAFLHGDWVHLLVNIIWMASFGGPLARRFGSPRFLLLALVAAIAAVALQYVLNRVDTALVIGASGAVSGMMAATARFAFSPGGPLAGGGPAAYAVPAEPITAVIRNGRAVAFILVWFVINVVFGLAGSYAPGVSGQIAWEAHIGGFFAGLLVFPLLDPVGRHPDERLAS
jgi:membrane associated rhomboid family serine protease